MDRMDGLELLTKYLPGLPVLALFLAGAVLAAVGWRRHPRVSLVTLIALALAITRFFLRPLVFDWLFNQIEDLGRAEQRTYLIVFEFADGLVAAGQ
jgi:hypothetical protein